MSIAESKPKKIIALTALALFIGGSLITATLLLDNKRQDIATESIAETTLAESNSANTTTAPKDVLGTQTTQTNGYDVSASKLANQSGLYTTNVIVKNTTDATLQLSPGLQFKLVGKTTGVISEFIATKDSKFTGGPLSKGATQFGTLTFQPTVADEYELRFFPDISNSNYLVVTSN